MTMLITDKSGNKEISIYGDDLICRVISAPLPNYTRSVGTNWLDLCIGVNFTIDTQAYTHGQTLNPKFGFGMQAGNWQEGYDRNNTYLYGVVFDDDTNLFTLQKNLEIYDISSASNPLRFLHYRDGDEKLLNTSVQSTVKLCASEQYHGHMYLLLRKTRQSLSMQMYHNFSVLFDVDDDWFRYIMMSMESIEDVLVHDGDLVVNTGTHADPDYITYDLDTIWLWAGASDVRFNVTNVDYKILKR